MADPKDTAREPVSELDRLAFEIFAAGLAARPIHRGAEQEAIASYRAAESFLAVRQRVRAGELKTVAPTGPQLADVSAPNLSRTHPLNLVSREFGSLSRVQTIGTWLANNPTPEKEPEQLLTRLNRQFPDLSWTLPMVNTAREIFPDYCAGSKN